ncbi:HD domain-containing phosphohydrolase [Alteromonas sp. ASW11-36]|uniref:HD domain-containing phosphohydrolase n=1 Tax=Alteromonas arenosi TaxID=3055817 RepID=A0ABT7SV68_9ALTE|nr:HD domain-containing phosphohydrolase [Alteromonas sp. ASW11-36]MDM7859442.1 HD domain-containing phosphohydrolase [Alteromonas sp. ASW11-36]
MQVFTPEELDDEILGDLMEEIQELYEASEQTLIELELRPEDNELQRSLFRSVHTIKGDLGLVSFSPMIPILQHVEDLLDYLRKGQIAYTSTMSDLVLITMDKVKTFVEQCMNQGKAPYDGDMHDRLVAAIAKIQPDNQAMHEKLLANAVLILDPSLDLGGDNDDGDSSAKPSSAAAMIGNTGIPKDLSSEKQQDILFFRDLMKAIERRSKYWEGRGDRIAKLASYVNKASGYLVDADQLAVACYTHDFGMAFMPLKLLNKTDKYSEIEFNLMRSHVYKSSRLLEHLDEWDGARKIVMQHHERVDGSGYPLGIKEKDMCEGAKLLAILDAYDAMTHSRAHNGEAKYSKKDAVIAINREAKGQYSVKWLRIFNQAMTALLTKQ